MPDTAFSLKEAGEILAKAIGLKPGLYMIGFKFNHSAGAIAVYGKPIEDALPSVITSVEDIILSPMTASSQESRCTFRVEHPPMLSLGSGKAVTDHLC